MFTNIMNSSKILKEKERKMLEEERFYLDAKRLAYS